MKFFSGLIELGSTAEKNNLVVLEQCKTTRVLHRVSLSVALLKVTSYANRRFFSRSLLGLTLGVSNKDCFHFIFYVNK